MTSYYMRIPIRQIRSNPENPRRVITQEMVDQKKASLKADGQLTPVKLRTMPAEGPDNNPSPCYLILGGELRYRAAQELGWEELDALVIGNLTPEEAELVSIMDNQGQDMNWLDWYQAIERRINNPQKPTQQQVADELCIKQPTVSRALKLLSVLNQASRDLIYKTFINTDPYQALENIVFSLTSLEDPQKVLDTIKVVIDRQMNEPEAQKLVAWVKKGNSPESFGEKVAKNPSQDPNDPHAALWPSLPPTLKMQKTPKGYKLTWTLTEAEAPVAAYGGMVWLEHMKQKAGVAQENLAYRKAFPDLLKECAKAYQGESAAKASQAEEARKAQEAKDQQKAQKAAAKEQAKALQAQKAEGKAQAQTQKEAQKREAFENSKLDAKTHLETAFGPGPLADGIYQKALAGEKTSALKAIKTTLPVVGKSPEEQETFMKDFKVKLSRLSRLNPQKPAVSPRKLARVKPEQKTQAGAPLPETVANPPVGLAQPNHANDLGGHSQAPQPHGSGLLDIVKGAVEKVAENVESGSLLGTVVEMTLKNAKQTANYEERKGMRKLFKDVFDR